MSYTPPMRRMSILAAATALATALAALPAFAGPNLTITLDTPPSHIRNIYVGRFAEALA